MVYQLIKEVSYKIIPLVIHNSFTNLQMPEGANRESYRQFIEATLKSEVETDKNLNMPNSNRRFIKNP